MTLKNKNKIKPKTHICWNRFNSPLFIKILEPTFEQEQKLNKIFGPTLTDDEKWEHYMNGDSKSNLSLTSN